MQLFTIRRKRVIIIDKVTYTSKQHSLKVWRKLSFTHIYYFISLDSRFRFKVRKRSSVTPKGRYVTYKVKCNEKTNKDLKIRYITNGCFNI